MQIALVLYPGLTTLDVVGPYEFLKFLPGADVRFVAVEAGPVPNDRGQLLLAATHALDEVPRPDLLLVPGSEAGTPAAMADRRLTDWIASAHEHTRYTCSVCSGALVLASAGVLKGLPATTHWAGMDFLARFGAEARPGDRIVRAGKVWTAAGVSAGIDLGLALIEEIEGREAAEVAQLINEYDPQPGVDAGHMSKAGEAVRARARAEMRRLSASPGAPVALAKLAWRRAIERVRRRVPT